MITIPSSDSLQPQQIGLSNGRILYFFPTRNTDLVKIDFLREAGSAYQRQVLAAAAACKLASVAGRGMNAALLSEFLDFRGIIVENNNTVFQSTTSFWTLARHLDVLLPVLDGLVHEPAFPEEEFDIYRRHKKQEIMASQQKSSDMARHLFYESLFGLNHPLGHYASPEDADRLDLGVVRQHYRDRCGVGDTTLVLSGHVDDYLLHAIDDHFGHDNPIGLSVKQLPVVSPQPVHRQVAIPASVQTSLRVGRLLPLSWDDPDYARLMVLVTLLGGYFGSRLMSNLREDKGYTYGIYARTQVYRGAIVFYITADVASSTADDAEKQIVYELQRLVDEPVTANELNMVRTVLAGDFLRSVDGIFERSSRFCDMMGTAVTERFTDNLRQTLSDVTPSDLMRIATQFLSPDTMTFCRAGRIN